MGYRRLEAFSVVASARRPLGSPGRLASPDWVAPEAMVHQRLGSTAMTAQVHPAEFTKGMIEAAIARGARLHIGCASGVELSSDGGGRVRGVVVDGELIEGDAVVIAMGPWSALASASGGEDLPSYTLEVSMPKVPASFVDAGVRLNSIALEFTRSARRPARSAPSPRVKERRSQDSGNTVLSKEFPGGC